MRRLASIGLAGMLAIAGIGLTAAPGDASHQYRSHHSGISFGFSYGYPYYSHDPYYTYRTYRRPHRVYRHRAIPRVRYGGAWEAHVAWCYNRYRSYRAWDNTFQPYHGPRRECRSPYLG